MTASPANKPDGEHYAKSAYCSAMPSEEEIARVLMEVDNAHIDRTRIEPVVEDLHRDFARAVLALFAPILAEKERRALEAERISNGWEDYGNRMQARALAAEAALAAERANAVDGSIDIGLDDKGAIDEIFGSGVLCHIERMNKGEWFVIMTRPDQSQEAFWLTGKGKVEITLHEHREAPTSGPNVEPWTIAAAIRAQGE